MDISALDIGFKILIKVRPHRPWVRITVCDQSYISSQSLTLLSALGARLDNMESSMK